MLKPDHIPQPAWDYAQQMLVEAPPMWTTDICAGGYISADGRPLAADSDTLYGLSGQWQGYVCHSYVQMTTSSPLLFDTQAKDHRKSTDEKANRAFFKWMLEASPVRNFILNDDLETLVHGGAIIDCQRAGSTVSLWICKAFRVMYEDQWRIPLWHKLVLLGVHPMLALCVSHCLDYNMQPQHGQSHCSIFKPPKTKEQLQFLLTTDHLPPSEQGLKQKNQHGYTYMNWETASVFPGGSMDKSLLPLNRKQRKEKVPDGWGGFVERTVSDGGVDEFAKELIEIQKEFV